jgi:hypothetical protein
MIAAPTIAAASGRRSASSRKRFERIAEIDHVVAGCWIE